ncbi:MAG: cell division protein FtsL [Limimaricola sp.]|uniref:cell division protein FtsL n=1 Tax=Limimaricola sp. TaxID=2211665 RepID=UPI001DE18FDB|nr:cell division protein FtsL [Limimaricola sp.]MBI1418587.1 cell division protein FtsL [Limimaricola sp.]
MRGLTNVLLAIAVMGLGFWAYRENYRTQQVMHEVRDLHDKIANAHERLAMLRAEWAYENRPDRLRELADMNFARLGLLPMVPESFGTVDAVPRLPLAAAPETPPTNGAVTGPITNPVATAAPLGKGEPL